MKKYKSRIAVFNSSIAAALLLMSSISVQAGLVGAVNNITVDQTVNACKPSITTDNNGDICISYYDKNTKTVKCAYKFAGEKQFTIKIVSNPEAVSFPVESKAMIDNHGDIHVTYVQYLNDYLSTKLIFASMKSSSKTWTKQTIFRTINGFSNDNPICADKFKNTYNLAYTCTGEDGRNYIEFIPLVYNDSTKTWSPEIAKETNITKEGFNSGGNPCMTITEDGTIYVAYEDQSDINNSMIDLVVNKDNKWQTVNISGVLEKKQFKAIEYYNFSHPKLYVEKSNKGDCLHIVYACYEEGIKPSGPFCILDSNITDKSTDYSLGSYLNPSGSCFSNVINTSLLGNKMKCIVCGFNSNLLFCMKSNSSLTKSGWDSYDMISSNSGDPSISVFQKGSIDYLCCAYVKNGHLMLGTNYIMI